MNMLLKYILFSILGATLGCHTLPQSVGKNQEIIVLADTKDWETLEDSVREIFEKILLTPQEEKVFSIKWSDLETFYQDNHQRRKIILVIAPTDATHPSAEFLKSLLSAEVQTAIETTGTSSVSWKEDVWAKEQLLMVVTGKTLDDVRENLWLESDRLVKAAEESRDKRLASFLYRIHPRHDVIEYLAQTCGWTVQVPFGYRILEAYPDSGFVALAKDNPNRWLFIYWEDDIHPDQLTAEWCIQKRNEITQTFFKGDQIVRDELDIFQTEFTGKLAVTLQGLWENKEEWKGGPFKSYAFVDIDQNRFFFIDLGMYAPNKNKEPYMRRVDIIARTFSSVPNP